MIENEEDEDLIEEEKTLTLREGYKKIISEESNPTIETLFKNYKDGELILHPQYQRNFVWDKQKASNLIESILLNISIPPIYTSDNGEYEEVIDGQQRLKSIFSFIEGTFPTTNKDFKLSKLKILKDLSGKKFQDLEKKFKREIRKKPLKFVTVKSNQEDFDQENIKFEMFERLNTNITRLNDQELRNCMYRGKYNDFLKKMAEYDDFQYIIYKPTFKKRMKDIELVLIFYAFYHTNYVQYKGNTKQLLNEDMLRNRVKLSDRDLQDLEKQFKKSVSLIKHIFDKNAFKFFTINDETKVGSFGSRLNVGLYEILMYWFTPYKKNQIIPYSDLIREELLNLEIHNSEFIDSITGSGTTSKDKVFTKFEIWGETIKGIVSYPKSEPRSFSYKLKEDLYNEDSTCQLCSQKIHNIDDAEVDHITCYWKGGKTVPNNARLTHRFCNRARGTKE